MKKIVLLPLVLMIGLIGCSPQTAPLETAAVESVAEQDEPEATVEPTPVPATATPEPPPTEAAPVISDEVLAMSQDELDDALLDAARKDNLELMQELLAAGADVNVTGSTLGFTPVTVAVVRGNMDAFTMLYEHGADLAHIDNRDNSLLHHAAFEGNADIAEIVLAEDVVDIEGRRDQFGFTPLLVAAFEDNMEVMDLLLDHGANIEAVDNWGDSPINVAAWNGNQEIIERLIERGAIIDSPNQAGNNALDYANSRGHEELAVFLEGVTQN